MDTALAFAPLLDDEEREKLGKAGLFRKSKSILRRCHPRPYRKGGLLGAAVGAILGIVVGAILYLLFSAIVGQTGGLLTGWPLVVLVFGPVLVLGLLLGWLGGPVLAAYDLFRLATKKMPEDNFYGLCIGSGEPGTPEQPLLTDWLSGLFDDLAGIKRERDRLPSTI